MDNFRGGLDKGRGWARGFTVYIYIYTQLIIAIITPWNIYKPVFDMSLVFVRSSGLSFDWLNIVGLWSWRIWSKSESFLSEKYMLIAKNIIELSKKVSFWIGILSDREDGLRAGSDVWDDGNTSNDDGSKSRCPYCHLAYIWKGTIDWGSSLIWRWLKILYPFKTS